jgi:hypothetical protein
MKYYFFEPLHEELSNVMSKFSINGFAIPNHNIFSTRTLCKHECDLDPQIYSQSMHM